MDPINGSSDLEIAHWCYKTKQKILFLLMQFLESVALPRTVVKATDEGLARQIATQIARMRGSAVLPVGTQGNANAVDIQTLDSSGKGADQFQSAINYLDQCATHSVLAGFLDLTGNAANGIRGGGGGSYALSKDASDYFLQFEEFKCREIERSIRRDLFGPLIRYNFGAKGKVPKLKFEPLNTEDKSQQIAMMTAAMQMPPGASAVPSEFLALLAQQVATYFGMDGGKVHRHVHRSWQEGRSAGCQQSAMGASPMGQGVAQMAGGTQAAAQLVAPATLAAGAKKPPLPPELQHIDWTKLGA